MGRLDDFGLEGYVESWTFLFLSRICMFVVSQGASIAGGTWAVVLLGNAHEMYLDLQVSG